MAPHWPTCQLLLNEEKKDVDVHLLPTSLTHTAASHTPHTDLTSVCSGGSKAVTQNIRKLQNPELHPKMFHLQLQDLFLLPVFLPRSHRRSRSESRFRTRIWKRQNGDY
ncbi:hypothetical protein CHARACLAT_026614 [Characodon lateralis]|uniref:Uncharacterized protein n=1 Tax=Characodon lateralis TaxID=208331 RepID=A0ABU7DAB4_9TELE|nr:hypothetical protein [Characodon lateralis]